MLFIVMDTLEKILPKENLLDLLCKILSDLKWKCEPQVSSQSIKRPEEAFG